MAIFDFEENFSLYPKCEKLVRNCEKSALLNFLKDFFIRILRNIPDKRH